MASASQRPLPTGTVTFLFSDIEGSTRLVQELADRYPPLQARQRELIEEAARAHGGVPFGMEGDAVFIAFPNPAGALTAAAEAQRALAREAWPDGGDLRVRMGVHTGAADVIGDNYVGLSLHQTARIMSAGHGGQVLTSSATRELAATSLPASVSLRDIGEHRLKDLAEATHLYQLVVDGLPDEFPPLKTLSMRANNLPVQLTSFIGRDELDPLRRLVAQNRLVTLTGPGGTGKTRLALQLAAEVSDDFPDGVFFVALDAIRDPELVPSAILSALGLTDERAGPPLERLVTHVGSSRMLLVLDNFEQVIVAADVVARLMRDAPDVKVLVTSRERLNLYGEHEFPVPPLAVPERSTRPTAESVARSPAVLLFVERALAVDPSFRLTDDNAGTIAEIAARLEGLPLAIELSAARLRLLPLESLRARLDERLRTLTGGPRDLPGRQQTLRGAIDWSHDLLDAPDRRLFCRFGVFAGGAFLEQVEAVCGPQDELGREVLDGLTSLVDKSLIRRLPTAVEPRFAMLQTIREYAVERLEASGEVEKLRRRHAETMLRLVEVCAARLTGAGGGAWLDRLDADHDNIRAALDWSAEAGDLEVALRIATAVWRFWQFRGHLFEASERFRRLLSLPAVADVPPDIQAAAFGAAGGIAYWRAQFADAYEYYRSALEQARRTGDEALIAEALYNQSFAPSVDAFTEEERFVGGRHIAEEALDAFRRIGDRAGIAKAVWALGTTGTVEGNVEAAERYLTESETLFRELDDRFGLGWELHMMGLVDMVQDRLDAAEARFRESLAIFQSLVDQSGILVLVADFGVLANRRGDHRRAWKIFGAVESTRQRTGVDLVQQAVTSMHWQVPMEAPPEPTLRAAWDEGRAMSLDEAMAYATEQVTQTADVTEAPRG